MNLIKVKGHIPQIIAVIVILGFFTGLLKNIDYVKFPNSDFFQYLNDGRTYLKLQLPSSIHPPPFAPIIISGVSKLFINIEHPELFSAHIINILCSSLALLNIYLIFSKTKPWIGLLTIILVATNKIYITTALNITNEVIFSYFLTLTLLAYSRKYYRLSYFLSGFSFFIRYEAIVIPIAIFVIELVKTKKIKFSHLLIAFTPIITWLVILNFHSSGNSIFQNAYINEIIIGKNGVPNPDPVNSLLHIIFSNPTVYFFYTFFLKLKLNILTTATFLDKLFILIIVALIVKNISSKKQTSLIKIIYLVLPLFIIFISIFPNFNIRYLFPVIWIIYLILINQKNKLISFFLFIIMLGLNYKFLNNFSLYDTSLIKSEYKLISNYLNQTEFENQTTVFVYDPRLLLYFNKNKSITFDLNSYEDTSESFTKCDNNIPCVIKNNDDFYKKTKILVITQSSTTIEPQNIQDKYTEDTLHHISAFHDDKISNNSQFKLIKTLSLTNYHWAKIYQFSP